MSINRFNHARGGWGKFLSSPVVTSLEALYDNPDKTADELASIYSLDKMDVLTRLARLSEMDLVEVYKDTTMGPAVERYKPKYTKKQIKKAIIRNILISTFKDWGPETLEVMAEELDARPALKANLLGMLTP